MVQNERFKIFQHNLKSGTCRSVFEISLLDKESRGAEKMEGGNPRMKSLKVEVPDKLLASDYLALGFCL